MAVKARRAQPCPAHSTERGGGERAGAKHRCAKPCGCSSCHGHHCGQRSGKSSAVLPIHGAGKDAGHEAVLPKPWGWGSLH